MQANKRFSEKSFGLLLSFIAILFFLYPLINNEKPNYYFLATSALLLIVALFYSKILKYPALLWYKLGLILHKILSPIILFIVYFFSIVIVGLIMKVFRRDTLKKKYDKNIKSYWIKVEAKSKKFKLKDQF